MCSSAGGSTVTSSHPGNAPQHACKVTQRQAPGTEDFRACRGPPGDLHLVASPGSQVPTWATWGEELEQGSMLEPPGPNLMPRESWRSRARLQRAFHTRSKPWHTHAQRSQHCSSTPGLPLLSTMVACPVLAGILLRLWDSKPT